MKLTPQTNLHMLESNADDGVVDSGSTTGAVKSVATPTAKATAKKTSAGKAPAATRKSSANGTKAPTSRGDKPEMNPTRPIPPWTHHTTRFWNTHDMSAPASVAGCVRNRGARPDGNLAPMQMAKDASKKAVRLNEVLRMTNRVETVFCDPSCDFFQNRPELAKARAEVLDMFARTPFIRWIVPVLDLDNFESILPKMRGNPGWQNVCLCIELPADNEEALARIERFRKIPAAFLMLRVGPHSRPLDLAGKLENIKWVVNDGGPRSPDPANDPAVGWSRALKDACQKDRIAFFHHRDGVVAELDGREWLEHPFGDKTDMARPRLPGSETILPAAPAATSSVPADDDVPEPVNPAMHEPTAPESPANEPPAATTPAKPKLPGRGRRSAQEHGAKMPGNETATASEPETDLAPADQTSRVGQADAGTDHVEDERETKPLELEVITSGKKPRMVTGKGGKPAVQDKADFQRLHKIVTKCAEQFVDAGNALREIRDRALWKAGGYATWNAYCESVRGITRRYVNLLISAAGTVGEMREVGNIFPTSPGLVPQAVTQVTPLKRIRDANLRNEAWTVAVERSGGKQPPGKVVEQVVSEVLARQDAQDKPAPTRPKKCRAERRAEVFEHLAKVVEARKDWALAARLVAELKDLL